jgi:hypothetical protein
MKTLLGSFAETRGKTSGKSTMLMGAALGLSWATSKV